MSFWCLCYLWKDSTLCFGVSIVDFKQVNADLKINKTLSFRYPDWFPLDSRYAAWLYCKLWPDLTYFPPLSIVKFEKLKASWDDFSLHSMAYVLLLKWTQWTSSNNKFRTWEDTYNSVPQSSMLETLVIHAKMIIIHATIRVISRENCCCNFQLDDWL